MDEFLIPRRTVHTRLRTAPRKTETTSSLMATGQGSKASSSSTLGTLSHTLRTANSLLLSLRDGLSAAEREHSKKVEERKQILALRMKNVCCVTSLLFASS